MIHVPVLRDVEWERLAADRLIERSEWQQHQLRLGLFPNPTRNEHPTTVAFSYPLWSDRRHANKIKNKLNIHRRMKWISNISEKIHKNRYIFFHMKIITYRQDDVGITGEKLAMVAGWHWHRLKIL